MTPSVPSTPSPEPDTVATADAVEPVMQSRPEPDADGYCPSTDGWRSYCLWLEVKRAELGRRSPYFPMDHIPEGAA